VYGFNPRACMRRDNILANNAIITIRVSIHAPA